MNNEQYRMRELLNPADGRSLVVDTSNGLVQGTLPGLERFAEAVRPLRVYSTIVQVSAVPGIIYCRVQPKRGPRGG